MKRGNRWMGIFLIVLSICGLFLWERWGKERLFTEEVLMVRENVPEGITITGEMLISEKTNVSERDCLKGEQKSKIIGLESDGFLHKGVPLFKENFRDGRLFPKRGEDQYTLSIAEGWIGSLPETLRKGSSVRVYGGKTCILSSIVTHIDEEKKCIEVIAKDAEIKRIMELVDQGNKLIVASS